MSSLSRELHRGQCVAVLAGLALAILWPVGAGAQTAAPRQQGQPTRGAAGAIAPTTRVVQAKTAARSAQPTKPPSLGRVVGTLSDAETGEALVGGQVAVRGLPLGNVSDESGSYFINNVPLGKQTLTVEYLGYESQAREHEVKPGNSNTVDFALNPTPIEGEEVLVEEEVVVDLSAYVDKTPAPTFKASQLRKMAVEESDTTLMEDWHRGWRNFTALHSIDYSMMGASVYFRRPVPKRQAQAVAAPAGEGADSSAAGTSGEAPNSGASSEDQRPE